jgi:hypothetical protein
MLGWRTNKTLRSSGAPKIGKAWDYKHLAPLGRSDKTVLLHFKLESTIYHLRFTSSKRQPK